MTMPLITFSVSNNGYDYTFAASTNLNGSGAVISSYLWDFGDGTDASAASPTAVWTFQRPGVYMVLLNVGDNGGQQYQVRQLVKVVDPDDQSDQAPYLNWQIQKWGLQLQIRDASYLGTGALAISGLHNQVFLFPYEDNVPHAGPVVDITLDTPGVKSLTYTALDNNNQSVPELSVFSDGNYADICTSIWTGACITGFGASINYLDVQFQNYPSTGPSPGGNGWSQWSWDFGDGQAAAGDNQGAGSPSHTYGQSGVYMVSNVGVDTAGDSYSYSSTIYVSDDHPLKAAWNCVINGTSVQFNDDTFYGSGLLTVDPTITEGEGATTWYWDFGDGSSSTERNPEHTYNYGTKDATLTVSGVNQAGDSVSDYTQTNYTETGNPIIISPPWFAVTSSNYSKLTVNFIDAATAVVSGDLMWSGYSGMTSQSNEPV